MERIKDIVSATLERAALATSSLGKINITKTLAGLADISEKRRKILLALAHQALARKLKGGVERDTPQYRLHEVMAANLLGRNFQQTDITPQSQQNISPDQPQDHS